VQAVVISDGSAEFKGADGVVEYVKKHGGAQLGALLGATDAEKKEVAQSCLAHAALR